MAKSKPQHHQTHCEDQNLQNGRINRIIGWSRRKKEAIGHPENPKIPKILLQTQREQYDQK